MAIFNKNELTKEQIEKAFSCKNADELIEMAKTDGIELTKDEAEAYLAEISDLELDTDTLQKVAGGMSFWDLCQHHDCPNNDPR